MADVKTKKNPETINDGISAVIATEKNTVEEPTVAVILPLLEEQDNNVEIDQTVNVTINGEVTQIRRGEYVNVKVPVFMQLRNRFPTI